MNRSNTTKKGDAFEDNVYQLLLKILQNDDFYVSGKNSKVFQKKGYHSKDRDGEIIFDISIETYIGNSRDYSVLTLIECKDYSSPISVNKIEEFGSKINQISAHNTKGIFITTSNFQKGAFNFAKSKGLGLIRLMDEDEYEWIARRKSDSSNRLYEEEISTKFERNEIDENYIAVIDGIYSNSISDSLLKLQVIDVFKHKDMFFNVPYIGHIEIEKIVARIQKYDVYSHYRLDEEKLIKFLQSKYQITFEPFGLLPADTLGKIEFNPLKITISVSLVEERQRRRFTLAHEVGHLILHCKIFQSKITQRTDTIDTLSYQSKISDKMTRSIEYQANAFASALLLPISSLKLVVNEYFREERISRGRVYWDHQHVNQKLALMLLDRISNLYDVSIEVARIRLITLGWLIDDRFNSMKKLLKEFKLMNEDI